MTERLDIFRACYADIPIRDQRDLMERPFFSLAKTPRMQPIGHLEKPVAAPAPA